VEAYVLSKYDFFTRLWPELRSNIITEVNNVRLRSASVARFTGYEDYLMPLSLSLVRFIVIILVV